jgi:tight adherence protein B
MLGIILVVFIAAFVLVSLVLLVPGMESGREAKAVTNRMETLVTVAPGITDDVLDLRKKEMLSSIPWLDRWLVQLDIMPRLRLLLYQADLKWTAGTLLLLTLACFGLTAYAVYWRTGVWPLGIMAGGVAATGPFLYVLSKRSQRFATFERLLPDALDLMVGALRAGHSLTSTIAMVGKEMTEPVAGEFRKCFDEQQFGMEIRTAMLNLVARVPIQPVRIIATAILIQKESGGNLAEVLDKAAYVIRERFKLRRQIQVHTAQGRLTGWILALLPVGLGFLLYLLKPEHFSLLWKRSAGIKMMYTAGIMTTIGALIIRKIVRIRV